MKKKIKTILKQLSTGEIDFAKAIKELDRIVPKESEIYNKVQEQTFQGFLKFLNEFGDE